MIGTRADSRPPFLLSVSEHQRTRRLGVEGRVRLNFEQLNRSPPRED